MSKMKDEKDMLLRLKNGDTEAFACVYRRYWRKVYRFASLYITLPADVEEVVQDVFLSLWKKRGTIEVEQGLDVYLFIATRNTVFNHLRRHFNYSFYRATVEEAVGNSYNNVEEDLHVAELRQRLYSLLGSMPTRRREVFLLSREGQLSYKEIAVRLGIAEKTVERHINEALKYLRQYLLES